MPSCATNNITYYSPTTKYLYTSSACVYPEYRQMETDVVMLTGNPEFEIWGDGEQTRSFCYVDDIVFGIYKLMQSEFYEPLNMGQDRMISMNDFADLVAGVAGVKIENKHVEGPQGVRGRNSDNTPLRETFSWEPEISLEEGIARTYAWIEEQVKEKLAQTENAGDDLAHSYENSRNPFAWRRRWVAHCTELAKLHQTVNAEIKQRAEELEQSGLKALDALHVACAEAVKSDYFLTCDDHVIRRCDDEALQVLNPVNFVLEIAGGEQ